MAQCGPYLATGATVGVCDRSNALLLGEEEQEAGQDCQEDDEGQLGQERLQDRTDCGAVETGGNEY